MTFHRFHSLGALLFAPVSVWSTEPVDFNRDIQPILSENCYHCHGPDGAARKAELRLDTKDGAFRSVDGITVVKPGDSAGSELITRIFSADKDEVMPTPKSNRSLTAEQKTLLKRWVEEGAKWGEHWAFVAPQRPAVPAGAAQNPIDAFVRAGLEKAGLSPAPEAPKEKLLRRVTLDLTGLPPTAEELDAFLQDASPEAYEKVVDRLLASPRYGERMVWEWLDAARYADTNGYQGDPTRAMWYWRDWTINALNANMPFDQFTVEQIAGDLLPKPTREQLVATGFHRNHMINGEGGRIPEESRVDYVQDRVETTGTVWLGLTFNCCRCHDHKFDPLSQREYYQLSAYFNSIDESGGGGNDGQGLANPTIAVPSDEEERKLAAATTAEESAKKVLDALEAEVRAAMPQWEATTARELMERAGTARWTPLVVEKLSAEHGTALSQTADGAVLASGPNPPKESFVVTAKASAGPITAFQLEALPDASFVNQGPGRADNGNFVLTEITLQIDGKPVALSGVSADFIQNDTHRPETVFDANQKTGWAVMPQFGQPHTLIFKPRTPIPAQEETPLSFRLDFKSDNVAHTLGKFRLSVTSDAPALLRPNAGNIRTILAKEAAERSAAEREELAKFYLEINAPLTAAREDFDAKKKAREAAEKALPRTMVMRERAKPRDTFILVKGAYDKYGDKVEAGTPAILAPLPADAPKSRLALAQWLVAPENPLTARVTINRAWQLFLGNGLVKSADDFGVQGDKPTHPELLDWLAVDFRESGWDVKRLHRQIVTSATYRQASQVSPEMVERDPENALLARGPRYRLPSWMLRDQSLAVSGLMVEKLGGPPVKVYQPANVWEDATFGQIKFSQDHGEALYRRSLYIFWRRIVAPTLFFDTANRQNCAVKTGRTNTPLHALVTLNDVTYVEASRAFAERLLKTGGANDRERLQLGFRLCTARPPQAAETAVLESALARLRTQYAANPADAAKLIALGESKADAALPPVELAAYTAVAGLLLNLDETLSKE